jgi:hypothetical protein
MKFGRVLTALSVAAAVAVPACSSSSSSKKRRSDDDGETTIVYGGAAGVGGTGATAGTGMVTSGGAAGVGAAGAGGAGASGGAATDCATICDVITRANCSNGETREQCVADCGPVVEQCPAELAAFAGCLSTTGSVVCDSAGDANVSGCDDSLIGLNGCSACLQGSSDDPCFQCQKTRCCSQMKAYLGTVDVFEFTECISACDTTSPTCISSCQRSFPIAGDAFNRLSQCVSASCATACLGS